MDEEATIKRRRSGSLSADTRMGAAEVMNISSHGHACYSVPHEIRISTYLHHRLDPPMVYV